MPSVSNEIISDITEHIQKSGDDFSFWCVGIARDWHSPVLQAHQLEEKKDGLICREAFTTSGAHSVIDHLVTQCGAVQDNTGDNQGGKLVYAYRKGATNKAESPTCPAVIGTRAA